MCKERVLMLVINIYINYGTYNIQTTCKIVQKFPTAKRNIRCFSKYFVSESMGLILVDAYSLVLYNYVVQCLSKFPKLRLTRSNICHFECLSKRLDLIRSSSRFTLFVFY